jgi:quercetin dioxygenase-like cupin family protein
MTFIDTHTLQTIERLPGWRGRDFDSSSMTFAYDEFDTGSCIHEHDHPQEEVWHVHRRRVGNHHQPGIQRSSPGMVAIVPANTRHAVKAISQGKAIVVDYPLCEPP